MEKKKREIAASGLNALKKSLTLPLTDAGSVAFGSPFTTLLLPFFTLIIPCPLDFMWLFGWEAAKRPTFSVYNIYYIPFFHPF